jgi:hypothetical protein
MAVVVVAVVRVWTVVVSEIFTGFFSIVAMLTVVVAWRPFPLIHSDSVILEVGVQALVSVVLYLISLAHGEVCRHLDPFVT